MNIGLLDSSGISRTHFPNNLKINKKDFEWCFTNLVLVFYTLKTIKTPSTHIPEVIYFGCFAAPAWTGLVIRRGVASLRY